MKERFGVPEDLAVWLEENLPGGDNAALRWQLRQAARQVIAWENNHELRVTADFTPEQQRAVQKFTAQVRGHTG